MPSPDTLPHPGAAERLIRLREVLARTGRSRSAWYADMAAGRAPAAVRIGERSVAWREREIDAWIAARPAARSAA
ncbi:AlpA family transcriptional regulator [Plasticicumulans lactativorans]|uniref:AlpA family transcriptional regulator n=1 Tax=Plasticicumulans lactativorans TaxID=1133106 RepID=A0A4V2SDE4_9GAMM|nr:AlpA family phage regulatory protein [Plasticicumulans lactativorans]TCO83087.1 AlpA family transcriptional regulator [Plasticicumulans lactativorans]